MKNNGEPQGNPFVISDNGNGSPKVAYSPDVNKYLVTWVSYSSQVSVPTVFGQFVGSTGNLTGSKFIITTQSRLGSPGHPEQLLYDSKNKKFVLLLGYSEH